jgi:hypothetical protein
MRGVRASCGVLVIVLSACGRFGFDRVPDCELCGDAGELEPDAAPMFDAPRGMPGVDTDGDTVFDDTDNCIAIQNVTQHDEDTDGYGDVCDNCPTYSNVDQSNVREINAGAAADTVGDACDPRPTQPGESIVHLDTFEGNMLGTNWTVINGTWTVAGDAVAQPSLISDQRMHDTAAVAGNDYIVETLYTFSGFDAGNVNGGVVYRMTNNGWLCAVFRDDSGSPTISRLMLWTIQNGAANFQRSEAVVSEPAIGSSYRIRAGAFGSNHYCALDSFQSGPNAPFTSNQNADGIGGLRTNRTTGTYAYVIVYALGGPI